MYILFDIAFKYSCIATKAIIASNSPITYLFGINNITTTARATIKPEAILF